MSETVTGEEAYTIAQGLSTKKIGQLRDPDRFKKKHDKEERKLAPFEGPQIVEHKSDTSERNKSGAVGDMTHRGCKRNALGGFFSS